MTSQKDVMNFFNKSKKKQSGQEELKFTEQNKHDKNEDKDGNEDGNTPIWDLVYSEQEEYWRNRNSI